MAASLELTINLINRVATDSAGNPLPSAIVDRAVLDRLAVAMGDGPGGDQVDLIAGVVRDLAAATPQTIDLTALPWVAGTKSFAGLRLFAAHNPDDAGTFTLFNSGANGWSPFGTDVAVEVGPGDLFLMTWRETAKVVDATHRLVKVDPGASALQARLFLAGIAT